MRRAVPLFLLVGIVLGAVAIRVGLPWFVNSGRARDLAQSVLERRLGGAVRIEDMAMPRWLELRVGSLTLTRPDASGLSLRDLETRATLRGLARRRIEDLRAGDVAIHLPQADTRAPAPDGTGSVDFGAFSWVLRHVSLPSVRIVRGGVESVNPLATLRFAADLTAGGQYDMTVEADAPAANLTLQGSWRYTPGQALPDGAALTFSADWERLLALAGRPALGGRGTVTGTVNTDAGTTTVRVQHPGLTVAGVSIGPGELTAVAQPAHLSEPVPVEVRFSAAGISRADVVCSPGPVALYGRLSAEVPARRLAWEDVEIAWAPGILFHSSGWTLVLSARQVGHAEVTLPEMPLETWAAFILPLRSLVARAQTVGGRAQATAAADWEDGRPAVTVEWRWADGSVALDDFRQVAGVAARFTTTVTPDEDDAWRVHARGTVEGGEVLWGAYYQDFAGRRFPVEITGRAGPASAGLSEGHVRADLGGFGRWEVSAPVGGAAADAPSYQGTVEGLDVDQVLREVVVPLLVERRPWIEDMRGRGRADVAFQLTRAGDTSVIAGRLRLTDVTVRDLTDRLGVEALTADVPFRLGPGAEGDDDGPTGVVRFEAAQLGPSRLDGAELPVRVWNNSAQVAAPYTTSLYGGTVVVDGIRGVGLLTPERQWEAALRVRGLDMAAAARAWDTVPLDGELNGGFPRIRFAGNTLAADGALQATIYGGALDMTHFGVENVSSPYRTYTADVSWTGIDLARATAALGFGQMTGRLDGHIRGLRVQAGQPAAFEAEFRTVRTRGVPQRISIQAVDNISVLGTGRGLSGMLARGLRGLFDAYRYEQAGFVCSLEQDRFYIGGGIMGPEGEYFVKGTLLPPRINVIRRDPTGTISFSEMVRRLEALRLSTTAGPTDEGETP